MKLNRFIALALIALLAVGVMGAFTYRSFAKDANQNTQQTTDCLEDDDANETVDAEDTDNIEEQCGDQEGDMGENEGDHEGDAQENNANEADETNGQDTADETASANTGISADQAQTIAETANPGTSTLNVEFDREGGKDLWEVELDNGLDIKVDANTGEIILTEQRD